MRVCWADPELDDRGSRWTDGGGALSPVRTGCMDIGMDLDDGGGVPGDQIEHKLTFNY